MLKESSVVNSGRTINELPVDHPDRLNVTAALQAMRRFDETHGKRYVMNRSGSEYLTHLGGLEYLFAYLATLKGQARIVDIGAGTTRGAAELTPLANRYGLDVEATVIAPYVEEERPHLPEEKIHMTAAEYLDGFDNNSVRGMLALGSIMYSAVPALAIARIDQVLVPGGVLKAAFSPTDTVCSEPGKYMQTSTPFEESLKRRGYDIATNRSISDQFDILVAVKPGDIMGNAQFLLDHDANDYLYQMEDLVFGHTRGQIDISTV